MRLHLRVRAAALLALAAALAGGCTFSTFNDYEDRAPAVKIEQESGKSVLFGVNVTTMPRRQVGELLSGASMVISGSTPAALNTVTFTVEGGFSNSEADNDDMIKDLDDPSQITALAAAPSDEPPSAFSGPFAYVGLSREQVGVVKVMDINTYDGPGELTAPVDTIDNFGLSVLPANLGGGDRADDLAIGARGAVILWRSSGWPTFARKADAVIVDSSPRWPASGKFEALAGGELAPSGRDEIAVAARDKNFVAVLHHITGFGGGDACDGACVDITSDANHCGGCGNECSAGEACVAGRCRLPDGGCEAPMAECGGLCVVTGTDNQNCGACGTLCDTTKGLYCKAGGCVCGAGRTQCGGTCVNTQASAQHCGGCGNACATGEVCEAGECKTGGCSGALAECDGACVNLETSPDHCGSCGEACTGNLTCQQQRCACIPYELLEIELPGNANEFGASLLIANVDKDPENELVVGAPAGDGGGAVYVYDIGEEHLSGGAAPPDPRIVTAEGAVSFGASLAVGMFNGKDQLLAVGAPSSDVSGTAKAGKIYLFDSQLDQAGVVELVRPVDKGQLGTGLAVLPFKGSDATHDVLIGSSAEAVYVFFANTTPDHDDFRR